MKKLPCMAELWLFEQLTPAEKRQIQGMARRLTFKKGELLFMEGDPAAAIFLITAGRVKLFKVSDGGKEIVLGYLTPHDLFGEEVLFSDGVRTFAAQAVEPAHVCSCFKSDFEALIAQSSAISIKVIQRLGQKVGKMAEQLADVAIYDTQERVVRTLARLAREYGEETELGWRLNFRLTHEDLGALVGASRVMVTNVLKALRQAGTVLSDDSKQRFIVNRRLLAQTETDTEAEAMPLKPPCLCFEDTGEA